MSATMDLAGRSLGRFRVLSRIGAGGMGTVYRATDTRLDRAVALKVLHAADVADGERRRRFVREARAAAALSHKNLAAVHDVGEADGCIYIAMELVEGMTLRQVVDEGPVPPDEVARIARAIAGAMARAHERGIVHRDLKPENVMLDADGEPKILDFGLARLLGERAGELPLAETATRTGTVLGTPAYMSPEQAKGAAVDARSDVFSIGVLLYELASGVRPFRGETTLDVLFAIDRETPAPLRDLAPAVPEALARVIARCLEKDPAARFASARALLRALDEGEAPRSERMRASPRLRLLFEIGRGGMGVAYLAIDEARARRLVVVKQLLPELALDRGAAEMFDHEARVARLLRHPNVVETLAAAGGPHPFLEMEYVEGETYDALVRRARDAGEPLELEASVLVLSRVLAALHHAHELRDVDGSDLRLVHRDVSPHNVIVGYDGAVKLLDFGVAKTTAAAARTQTGVVKGKLVYLAPEQATGGAIDRRADVFAVGIMLWQAITGRRMWSNMTDGAILGALRRGEIPAPSPARPGCPPALVAVCARALARDPDARFATAEEMRVEMERAVAGGSPHAPLARRMESLFAEGRARKQARVDEALASGAGRPLDPRATTLPESPAARSSMATAELGHTIAAAPEAPRPRRGRATALLVATGVATLALAAAVAARPSRGAVASGAPAASSVASPRCASNAECRARLGEPALCAQPEGTCVPLASEECRPMGDGPELEDDATIWFGTMFPRSGELAEDVGVPSERAVDLARRDFATIAGGIPSARAEGRARPIGIVACDDATRGERAAHHLIDELRLPAVIGFRSSQEVLDLAPTELIPQRALGIAALNVSPLISAIPHPKGEPRLVWRTALNSAHVARAMARFVSDVLEPQARARSGRPKSTIRVAFLRPASTAGLGFADALFSSLRFNGRSVLENGADFREIVFAEGPDGAPDYAGAVERVLKLRPDLVLYVGEDELVEPVLEPLERRWPSAERPRPLFLAANSIGFPRFVGFLGADAERRHRYFGVTAPATTVANARLMMRFNERYPDKVTLDDTPGSQYDALYVLAYAAYAAGDAPITGPALARGIERLLPPGKPLEVGPSRIYEAFEALRNGENVDLQGAGSTLDFDVASGDTASDYAIVCAGVDENGHAAGTVESGLLYDARHDRLEGGMQCR